MPAMLFTLTLSHLPQAFLPRLGTPFILGTTRAGGRTHRYTGTGLG